MGLRTIFGLFVVSWGITGCASLGHREPSSRSLEFKVIERSIGPVIDVTDAPDNKYGFEGGAVVKVARTYHLFVAEMTGEPYWRKMRLAHWRSSNAVNWKRVSTLYESSGYDPGSRNSYWSPMPVFDEKENAWTLFYVAYSLPGNSNGTIWRAISRRSGRTGIDGPYDRDRKVFGPSLPSSRWEGPQGTDSFYPYRNGERWLSFYGSYGNGEPLWRVGLAEAPELYGPWTRVDGGEPVAIERAFAENPIVTRIGDRYLAIYDSDVKDAPSGYSGEAYSVGYSVSDDGVKWENGKRIAVQTDGEDHWAEDIRTPLGLVDEGGNEFTLLYTAKRRGSSFFPVGRVRLKLIER